MAKKKKQKKVKKKELKYYAEAMPTSKVVISREDIIFNQRYLKAIIK